MSRILVTIAKFEDTFEADLARALLEENGIEAFLRNEVMFSLVPISLSDKYYIELQVVQGFEEQALDILDRQKSTSVVSELLKEAGAVLEGHFLLTSGKHSGFYVEKIKLLQIPAITEEVCNLLADKLSEFEFDTVVGPAYGGIVLAFEVARTLEKGFVFTQRQDGVMSVRSGFDLSEVKKVAVVEDIVTTGGSVAEVIACLQAKGIGVAVVAAIVDRSGGRAEFGCPFQALLQMDIPTWEVGDCPLCAEGQPLTKPGSSDKNSPLT
jgi:orotate phosphoribosyltransferase